jgi:aspartate aminotransferase-like enzyme
MTAKYRLMVPGPTTAAPEVLAAGALPVIDERIPRFAALFHRTLGNLRQMFGTTADVLVFASSMTGAFESVVQNTCSPGDRILVVNNGFFAQRWVDLGRAYGLDVVDLRHEWGEPADPGRVAAALAADPAITAAVCVHCETSTGAMSDLPAFGAATRDVLSIVDAASSLGAGELRADDWGIDVVIGGGQKALGVPAGLGFVTVGERAWRAHETARLPRFYFDWTAAHTALTERGATPWTPAVSLITQLDVALQALLKEGLSEVWRRHARMAAAARAGLTALDLRLTVAPENASPAVTGVWMPAEVDSREVVARMLDEHGIQITGGLGPQTGRVARIGHCGYADGLDVVMTLSALERTLAACGHKVAFGAGVAAAQQALYSETGSA